MNNIPVPTRHPVYDYLERMEAKGIITFHSGIRPLPRGEIIELLCEIESKSAVYEYESSISRRELIELKKYLLELTGKAEDYTSNWSKLRHSVWSNSFFYKDGINLYSYEQSEFSLEVNPILFWDIISDSTGETLTRRVSGINVAAGLGEKAGLWFDFRDTQERGRGPYFEGERYKLYSDNAAYVSMDGGDVAYYDITRALLSVSWGRLWLNFGRGDNVWGVGRVGNLMLSDNPPPYDFLSLRYDVGNFLRFGYMTGTLHPYPEIYASIDTTIAGQVRKRIANKYIAGHRLEIYPLKGVEIGLAESVIYGERGLEPAYLNPVNLYFSAEHNLGDMDNVAWAGDVQLNLIRGLTVYGELFLDDLKTSELGTSYYSNKFAWTAGMFLVDPLKFSNTDITLEYSRIEPFVYTHFYPINVYKNWNSSLGHFLPPNSESLFLKMCWKPFYTLSGNLSAAFLRHGRNTAELNAGGDIEVPVEPNHIYTPFMAGKEFTSSVYELGIKWEPLEHYYLEGKVRNHRWSGGDSNEWEITFGVNVW